LREIIPEETYRKQLDVIVRNAERLKEIIESLNQARNFDHGTASIRCQRTSLNTLLQTVTQPFEQEAAENRINLKLALPEADVQSECDPGKLGAALGNVIKNAIVFSDAGDNVTVGLHKLRTYAMISVTDTGIGIDPADKERIFSKFYRVDDVAFHSTSNVKFKGAGPGLGLPLVKGIIEAHAGKIWVESPEHNEESCPGSQFHIALPLQLPEVDSDTAQKEDVPPDAAETRRWTSRDMAIIQEKVKQATQKNKPKN
jgi:signal transduction histidine kinase